MSSDYTAFFISSHPVPASILDEGIAALSSSYDKRFKKVFPFPSDYTTSNKDAVEAFSQAITANLIGGVGYFYGTSIVNEKFSFEWDEDDDADDSSAGDEVKGPRLTDPKALLTATPSRSFFPRGFYW